MTLNVRLPSRTVARVQTETLITWGSNVFKNHPLAQKASLLCHHARVSATHIFRSGV